MKFLASKILYILVLITRVLSEGFHKINVGATNHGYIKVSDALRDTELQQPPHLFR
jgi:hypothetical protein